MVAVKIHVRFCEAQFRGYMGGVNSVRVSVGGGNLKPTYANIKVSFSIKKRVSGGEGSPPS